MHTPTPFISIILPVFNEETYLEQCLSSLQKIDYPRDRFEIITVDNGSQDNSQTIAMAYADRALCFPEGNVGAVRNYGVENATGELIVFLDSDCLVSHNWLTRGVDLITNHPNGIFGGTLFLRDNPAWIEKYWLLHNPQKPLVQRDLLGACIFIHKQHFLDVGGFNETVTSGEDSELSKSLREFGHDIIIDNELGVVHLGNPTSIKTFLSRQMWHSENYCFQWQNSFKDITFWMVLLFMLGAVTVIVSGLRFDSPPRMSIFFLLAAPFIFSLKRIRRSHYRISGLKPIIFIYFLDFLYLTGRSTGLLKGATILFYSKMAKTYLKKRS